MDELLDVVDEYGNPTGETVYRKIAHRDGITHRTSHIWLLRNHFDEASGTIRLQVLLQKRSDNKDSFPGCFDISSAGHIPAGFSFEESALRELKEELGLERSLKDLHFLQDFHKNDTAIFDGVPYRDDQISRIFYMICDLDESEFKLQKEEVSAVKWFYLDECKQNVIQNTFKHCMYLEELEMLPVTLEE